MPRQKAPPPFASLRQELLVKLTGDLDHDAKVVAEYYEKMGINPSDPIKRMLTHIEFIAGRWIKCSSFRNPRHLPRHCATSGQKSTTPSGSAALGLSASPMCFQYALNAQ